MIFQKPKWVFSKSEEVPLCSKQYSRVKCACVSSKYSHSWIYTIRTPKTYAEIKVRSDQGVILPAQSHFGMKTRHRQRLLLQESNDQLIFPTVGPEWKPAYLKFLPYKQQLPHLKPSNNPLVRSYLTSQIIKYWEWLNKRESWLINPMSSVHSVSQELNSVVM